MSWSLYIPKTIGEGGVTTRANFKVDAEAAWDASIPEGAEADTEQREAFDAAVFAAISIINSGAVGPADAGLTVYVGGHVNAKHLPSPPNANDYITVTVTQARVPA